MNQSFTSLLLLIFLLAILKPGYGQDAGDALFDNSVVHEVHLDFPQSGYWERMVENFESTFGTGEDVTYEMGKVTIDGEVVDSVGIRFKGFTSYQYDSNRKPIKIDLNEFVTGKRYDGLRKFNLNIGFGDPSLQRDVISYGILRDMGLPAPRTAYAKVFINGEYWGLYQLIEQVDSEFLSRNFSNSKGNLFKNIGWSHLEWLGNDKTVYKENMELKTNEDSDDWSGFVAFVNFLNNSTDVAFENEIEKILNVEDFLGTLAVDVATNNWDSYLEHGRNYYMYQDTSTGLFNWIPWDYNFALGGTFEFSGSDCFIFSDFVVATTGTETVAFQDVSPDPNIEEWLWEFGDGQTSPEHNPVHTYDEIGIYEVCFTVELDENCTERNCKMIDLSEDLRDCNAITSGQCTHPADVIFAAVTYYNPNCCGEWTEDCELIYQDLRMFIDGEFFGFTDFPIDQSDNTGVLINRLLNVPKYRELYYNRFCDLLNNVMVEERINETIADNFEMIKDAVITDPHSLYDYDRFLEDIGNTNSDRSIKEYLSKRIDSLQTELDVSHTCPSAPYKLSYQEIVINEIIASNDSIGGQADPDGGYPDWIELYNTSVVPLDLSGAFLSDDKSDLRKWQFPTGTQCDVDDYLIVWADNDLDQSGLHASFKLSKGGESIYLTNIDGSIIDSLTYGVQETNTAFARIPNGEGDFKFWSTTFKDTNDLGMSDLASLEKPLEFLLYPNPVEKVLNINILGGHSRHYNLELVNSIGEVVSNKKISGGTEIITEAYPAGIYSVRICDGLGTQSVKRIIIIK